MAPVGLDEWQVPSGYVETGTDLEVLQDSANAGSRRSCTVLLDELARVGARALASPSPSPRIDCPSVRVDHHHATRCATLTGREFFGTVIRWALGAVSRLRSSRWESGCQWICRAVAFDLDPGFDNAALIGVCREAVREAAQPADTFAETDVPMYYVDDTPPPRLQAGARRFTATRPRLPRAGDDRRDPDMREWIVVDVGKVPVLTWDRDPHPDMMYLKVH